MAADRNLLVRALVRGAKLANPASPQAALESILLGRFNAEATDGGKTLISTNEAGGGVTFALPGDFGPADVMALCEEALQWLLNQPDPTNPNLTPRRITRLRVNFRKAVL
jgi:hypothetical protein